MIDTGDIVFHRPSRESWLVAYVRGEHLCACGWPETLAQLSDCLLVEKASADELRRLHAVNVELLEIMRNIEGVTNDRMTAALARAALANAEGQA